MGVFFGSYPANKAARMKPIEALAINPPTVLDWANSRGIGFSHFISVGDRADIDFGDLIDYLGSDANTRAIFLYIESIKSARKFMLAARVAARNKPIIVGKAGRSPEGAEAATSHTGALAGADDVFDAAIRRAGMLRGDTLLDLFTVVETFSHRTKVSGERLAIMTNGGGAGVMAADFAALGGCKMADLSRITFDRLNRVLPPTWSHANPVEIIGDAPAERYVETLKTLVEDAHTDAVLFMHAPTAIVPSEAIASACAPVAATVPRLILSCWLGIRRSPAHAQFSTKPGSPTTARPRCRIVDDAVLLRHAHPIGLLWNPDDRIALFARGIRDVDDTLEPLAQYVHEQMDQGVRIEG